MMIWPRRSYWRSAQYFAKRALRLSATPHAIAAGVAAGVFASFTPFVGFHFMIAAAIAWIIRGNLVASAIGTFVGNPLTFPLVWGATLEIGKLILHGWYPAGMGPQDIGHLLWHLEFAELWEPFLKPMAVGSLPLGLAAALLCYVLTRWAAVAFREQRKKHLAEWARNRAGNHTNIGAIVS